MTSPSNPGRCSVRGFTLIELMITVAIIGILAAIALPAYKDSVIKGKRAQGRTALLELAQAQERYFTANNCYLTNSAAGVADATPTSCTGAGAFKLYSGDSPATPAYKLQATTSCPGTTSAKECVRLTAVPQFVDLAAGNLTLDTNGYKSCSGSNSSVCWP